MLIRYDSQNGLVEIEAIAVPGIVATEEKKD